MLRFGVTRRDAPVTWSPRGVPERHWALTLLEDLHRSFGPADELLLQRLYDEVLVAGGVYKSTRRNRFEELDVKLLADLDGRWPRDEVLRVHDVGASNAITSLELFRKLSARRPCEVRATDWYDSLDVVRVPGSRWTVVFDRDARPIQLIGRRFVLSPVEGEARRYPLNRFLLARLRKSLLPRALALLQERGSSAPEAASSAVAAPRADAAVRSLPLWHPEALQAARSDPRFTLGRHDLFAPSPERWHFIRALNVLNPGYFPPDRLALAVRSLRASLLPGGVLLVGRTLDDQDGRTLATAFLRGASPDAPLTPAWDLHGGSEIRALVLSA